jgi:hypothetical protein
MGAEVFRSPFDHVGMLLMLRIGKSREEVFIARHAANVLRRTAPFCFEEQGIIDPWNSVVYAFDLDRVLPAIAKIIKILERLCTVTLRAETPGAERY